MPDNVHIEREERSARRSADLLASHPQYGPNPALAAQNNALLPASLLGNAQLRNRGNEPVRQQLMQSAQGRYGNRAVQRFMQQMASPVHVQRELDPYEYNPYAPTVENADPNYNPYAPTAENEAAAYSEQYPYVPTENAGGGGAGGAGSVPSSETNPDETPNPDPNGGGPQAGTIEAGGPPSDYEGDYSWSTPARDAWSSVAWDIIGMHPIGGAISTGIDLGKAGVDWLNDDDEAMKRHIHDAEYDAIGMIPGYGTGQGILNLGTDLDAAWRRSNGASAEEAPTAGDIYHNHHTYGPPSTEQGGHGGGSQSYPEDQPAPTEVPAGANDGGYGGGPQNYLTALPVSTSGGGWLEDLWA